MPTTTDTWDLWFPDEDSPVSPLEGLFSTQAVSIGVALSKLQSRTPAVVANNAERGTRFPTPRQGNSVFNVATGRTETYYTEVSGTNPGGALGAGAGTWLPTSGAMPMIRNTVDAINTAQNGAWSKKTGWNLTSPQQNRGGFAIANETHTVPVPGMYQIMIQITTNGAAGGDRGIRALVNSSLIGTMLPRFATTTSAGAVYLAEFTDYVAGGSTISFEVFNSSGADFGMTAAKLVCRYLGPA